MIFGLILTVILLPFAGGMLLQVLKFKEDWIPSSRQDVF